MVFSQNLTVYFWPTKLYLFANLLICLGSRAFFNWLLLFLFLGFPVINDPLYNHTVFGPNKGKGGIQGKSDAQLIQDLIAIHNAENWLGMDGDSELSMFNKDGKAPFFFCKTFKQDLISTDFCKKWSKRSNSDDYNLDLICLKLSMFIKESKALKLVS